MTGVSYFARPELAQQHIQDLFDTTFGRSGGLFLAAPRGTGKSTFVLNDLVPALVATNATVIYVDLWADKKTDPAILISDAIRVELKKDAGVISKYAEKMGLGKISIGALGNGLSFDLSSLGLSNDMTLSGVLSMLVEHTGGSIVLVIDEAQHALTTGQGSNAMAALKAARDKLSIQGKAGCHFFLVATGSNREKLATMVTNKDEAFYGADFVDFPKLSKDYLAWLFAKVGYVLDVDKAYEVFKKAGGRPEAMALAMKKLKSQMHYQPVDDPDLFLENMVRMHLVNSRSAFLTSVSYLPALQVAILHEVAAENLLQNGAARVGMFSAKMLARLQARVLAQTGSTAETGKLDFSAVQNGLDALRDKAFLWKAQRGAYWIEDD